MIERLQARREDEGFTLIELLIVIIILGILAAIVVFAVGSTRKDSVTSSCKTDAKSIELSLEAQNTKYGAFPSNSADVSDSSRGALLKNMPSTSDYDFTYTASGATSAVTAYTGLIGNAAYTVTINSAKNVTGGTWTNTSDTNIATACAGK